MESRGRMNLEFHISEVVFSIIVLLWYILPLFSPTLGSPSLWSAFSGSSRRR